MISYVLSCLIAVITFDIKLEEHCQLVEINNYLKVRCRVDKQPHNIQKREISISTVNDANYQFRCWNSTDLYNVSEVDLQCSDPSQCCAPLFTDLCDNDYHFYQLCGFTNTYTCSNYNLNPSSSFCGNYLCAMSSDGTNTDKISVPYPDHRNQHICTTYPGCLGQRRSYCERDNMRMCSEEDNAISVIGVCDGVNDCSLGSDELNCLHPYGVECYSFNDTNQRRWVPVEELCDNVTQCHLGYDEHKGTCFERKKKDANCTLHPDALAEIAPDRVCRTFEYKDKGDEPPCRNGHDQMNCLGDQELWCNSTFINENNKEEVIEVSLSRNLICDNFKNCVDGIDEDCRVVGYDCYIHKHRLCDGIRDCLHGEDEDDFMCLEDELTKDKKCIRRVDKYRRMLLLPHLWLCDDVRDCEDGMDEVKSNWYECKHTQAESPWQLNHAECVEEESKCVTWFICPQNDGHALPKEAVCNGMIHSECPEEARMCAALNAAQISRHVHPFRSRDKTILKYVSYCVPGLLRYRQFKCEEKKFTYFGGVFGVTEELYVLPEDGVDCANVYGEEYVLLACMGKCTNPNITCPLKEHPPDAKKCGKDSTIQHVYLKAPSMNGSLFLVKHREMDPGEFESDLYSCDNDNCIPISNVCDLDNNCGDWSDELYCNNSFKCLNGSTRVAWGSVCDGQYDCVDFSDECNSQCSKRLIHNLSLSVCAWIFGLFSFSMNVVVVIKSVRKCLNVRSNTSFVNHVFMSIISIGNFMTGIYLLGIAVANTVYYSDYCTKRYEWRLSSACSFLGAVQVVGCQITLFNMLILALYRGYVTRFAVRPSSSHKAVVIKILLIWIVVLIVSVMMAVVPLIGTWGEFFINGYYHKNLSGLFLGAPDKYRHLEILSAYHGHMHAELNWEEILNMVENMFALPQKVAFAHRILNFYSSNSVCLFKYFVTEKDPQRQYIIGVTLLNVTCNIVMCTAYFVIIAVSKNSAKTSTNVKNKAIKKRLSRQQAMVRRITIIIVIGVITWLPVVTICALHYNTAVDASQLYDVIAILAFPLGSLAHPLVCDKVLRDGITNVLRKMSVGNRLRKISAFDDGTSVAVTSTLGHSPATGQRRHGRVAYSVSGTSDTESVKTEGIVGSNNHPETSITMLSAVQPTSSDPKNSFVSEIEVRDDEDVRDTESGEKESDRRVRFIDDGVEIAKQQPSDDARKPPSFWRSVANAVRPFARTADNSDSDVSEG